MIDLIEALRASLGKRGAAKAQGRGQGRGPSRRRPRRAKERKGVKRAPKVAEEARRARARAGAGSDERRPTDEPLHDPQPSRRCWACRAASSPA